MAKTKSNTLPRNKYHLFMPTQINGCKKYDRNIAWEMHARFYGEAGGNIA